LTEFNYVIREYAPLLSRVASTYEANPSLQQELYQEICVAVWQALQRFKSESSVKTYILRVAHNRGVSHVSKQVKMPSTVEWNDFEQDSMQSAYMEQTQESAERQLEKVQQINRLLAIIRKMKLPARQVISLSLEGLSYQEIGEVVGLTTSNVGVMINRIKTDLYRQMHNE